LAVRGWAFRHPVRDQDQPIARLQLAHHLTIAGPLNQPNRHAPIAQHIHPAIAAQHQRVRMPGLRQCKGPVGHVHLGIGQGKILIDLQIFDHQAIQPLCH
jgi:hypothetical protein